MHFRSNFKKSKKDSRAFGYPDFSQFSPESDKSKKTIIVAFYYAINHMQLRMPEIFDIELTD